MSKKKNITLFGYIGETVKAISDQTGIGDNISATNPEEETIATVADVRSIVEEMVTAGFINSAIATENAVIPTSEIVAGEFFVYCNGTPVVIKERTDGVEGCAVTWDGGEILADTSMLVTVFGGRHDDETPTNSDITIEGGKVNYVVGGGLHKSYTVKSKIVMNGGEVKMVRAGACDQWVGDCSCDNRIYTGDVADTWARVDSGEIVINGGHITSTVFGGGNGFSKIKNVSIEVNDGAVVDEYVFAGGANGIIEKAKLVVNGGKLAKVLGCCRGEMDTIDIEINGGVIGTVFAGGEIPFIGTSEKPNGSDCYGKFNKSTVNINGGEISEISMGGNDYQVIEGSDLESTVIIVDNR